MLGGKCQGEIGPGKRTWELGGGMANGRGDVIGPPAWFITSEPVRRARKEREVFMSLVPLSWSLPLSGGLSHNSLLPGSSSHLFSSHTGPGAAKGFLTTHPHLCKNSLNNPNLSAVVCWKAEKYGDI